MNENGRLGEKGKYETGQSIFSRISRIFCQFWKVIIPSAIVILPMALIPVVLIAPGLLIGQPSIDPYDPDVSPPPPTPPSTPKLTPVPTLAPTPCPPHLPGQTVVVSLSWIDEGSITVEIPHIGKVIDIPMNYEMTGSATFEIDNTCPSITIPDGIRTDALNIPSVSLELVVGSVGIDAELDASLIGQQVSSPSCGDGGSMSKYSATAVANTELTISVSLLFWGTKVWDDNYPFGDDIPVDVKTKCVYCPECD